MGVTIKDLSTYNTINSINFGEKIVFLNLEQTGVYLALNLIKFL